MTFDHHELRIELTAASNGFTVVAYCPCGQWIEWTSYPEEITALKTGYAGHLRASFQHSNAPF